MPRSRRRPVGNNLWRGARPCQTPLTRVGGLAPRTHPTRNRGFVRNPRGLERKAAGAGAGPGNGWNHERALRGVARSREWTPRQPGLTRRGWFCIYWLSSLRDWLSQLARQYRSRRAACDPAGVCPPPGLGALGARRPYAGKYAGFCGIWSRTIHHDPSSKTKRGSGVRVGGSVRAVRRTRAGPARRNNLPRQVRPSLPGPRSAPGTRARLGASLALRPAARGRFGHLRLRPPPERCRIAARSRTPGGNPPRPTEGSCLPAATRARAVVADAEPVTPPPGETSF